MSKMTTRSVKTIFVSVDYRAFMTNLFFILKSITNLSIGLFDALNIKSGIVRTILRHSQKYY